MPVPTFDELYAAHADDVLRRCVLLVGNRSDGEDVFQQVWVKVHFALPSFRGDAQPSTWLYRIATNEALNFLRSRRSRPMSVDVAEASGTGTPDPSTDIDSQLDVTKLLSVVSDEERALLVLKYLDGYSYADIADAMGMGESAVKMRIARLKERLADQ